MPVVPHPPARTAPHDWRHAIPARLVPWYLAVAFDGLLTIALIYLCRAQALAAADDGTYGLDFLGIPVYRAVRDGLELTVRPLAAYFLVMAIPLLLAAIGWWVLRREEQRHR